MIRRQCGIKSRRRFVRNKPGDKQAGFLRIAQQRNLLLHPLRPKHLVVYEETILFNLAAAYSLGIVKIHPFLDGNKRAGFMAAYIFLGTNGYDSTAPKEK